MGYQTGMKRCARCQKATHHWRELPDIPRRWLEFIELSPWLAWKSLVTGWTCRNCNGVPPGPLPIGAKKTRP